MVYDNILTDQHHRLMVADEDVAILEKQISFLVEGFENKWPNFAVTVKTRNPSCSSRYKLSKGGAAQVFIIEVGHVDTRGVAMDTLGLDANRKPYRLILAD